MIATPAVWVSIIWSPTTGFRHAHLDHASAEAGLHALAPGERCGKVSACTFVDLATALQHPVIISHDGITIIPESASAAAMHKADLEREGRMALVATMAEYVQHGKWPLVEKYLGVVHANPSVL